MKITITSQKHLLSTKANTSLGPENPPAGGNLAVGQRSPMLALVSNTCDSQTAINGIKKSLTESARSSPQGKWWDAFQIGKSGRKGLMMVVQKERSDVMKYLF